MRLETIERSHAGHCRKAVLWVLIALLGLTSPGQAQQPSVWQIQPGIWVAGIPTEEFRFFARPDTAGHQRKSNWCWAACVQMVLNYRGIPVTQEQVVKRIFRGELPDEPAGPDEILEALSGWALTRNGQRVVLSPSPFAYDETEIVNDLAGRWPIIVGLSTGHAYVLTAVTFERDRWKRPILRTAVLRDPWPENQSRVEMDWKDFQKDWIFMARLRVSCPC